LAAAAILWASWDRYPPLQKDETAVMQVLQYVCQNTASMIARGGDARTNPVRRMEWKRHGDGEGEGEMEAPAAIIECDRFVKSVRGKR